MGDVACAGEPGVGGVHDQEHAGGHRAGEVAEEGADGNAGEEHAQQLTAHTAIGEHCDGNNKNRQDDGSGDGGGGAGRLAVKHLSEADQQRLHTEKEVEPHGGVGPMEPAEEDGEGGDDAQDGGHAEAAGDDILRG